MRNRRRFVPLQWSLLQQCWVQSNREKRVGVDRLAHKILTLLMFRHPHWCDEVLSRKARDPKMSKAPEIHKISKICCYFADDEGKLSTIAYVFLLKCFKVNSLIFTRKIWYFSRVIQKSNRNWSLSPPLFFAHWAREKVWFPYWKSFPFSRSGENKRKK